MLSYHLTDVPSFLSGEWLAFSDPHKKYANPGTTAKFVSVVVLRIVMDHVIDSDSISFLFSICRLSRHSLSDCVAAEACRGHAHLQRLQ